MTDKYSASKGIMCTDQVVKCNKCGLVYINPRIKEDIIIDSCSKGDDKVYTSQPEGRILTFKKEIKLLKKYKKKNGKLLDVGCAAGFFLHVAKQEGWNVQGVEPNSWLADYGRKNFEAKVFNGTLEEAKFKDNMFDIITMWDVLEHIPDPKSALIEANRILKPGGILIISFPDFSSIFAKLFGKNWWFLLSHHLFQFTPKTLKRMLRMTGFKTLKYKMHWQILSIGYLLKVVKVLSKNPLILLGRSVVSFFVKLFGLQNMNISYYASQTDLIAKKVK